MSNYKFNNDAYHNVDNTNRQQLTANDISYEQRFDDMTDTTNIIDYITKNERRYTPYIDELKSGIIRIKNNETANKLFGDVYEKFKNIIDSVEIFSVIIDYFGFGCKDFFDKLIYKYRMILIDDLSKRSDFSNNLITNNEI